MMSKVNVELDLENDLHRDLLKQLIEGSEKEKIARAEEENADMERSFVNHVLGTKAGASLINTAMKLSPNASFNVSDLAAESGHPVETIASWIRVIGRSEKSFQTHLFERDKIGNETRYSLPTHVREITVSLIEENEMANIRFESMVSDCRALD